MVHAHGREFVGLVERALGGRLVDAHARQIAQRLAGTAQQTLHPGHDGHAGDACGVARHDLRHDGLAGRVVAPGHGLAAGVQAGLEARDRRRTIEVVRGVLLARPDHLHRAAGHGLGDGGGLGHEIDLEPAPEAAAEQRHLQVHLAFVDAQDPGHHAAGDVGHLGRRPAGGRAILHEHGAVDRLHRHVREVGRAVLGRHRLGCAGQGRLHIATGKVGEAIVAIQRRRKFSHQPGAGDRGGRAVVPLHGHLLDGLHGLPGLGGDDGHAAGTAGLVGLEGQHLAHAGQPGDRRAVVHGHAPAQRGAHQHAGVEHAGLQHVDPEARRAVDLARRFQPVQGLADELEHRRVLERGLVGHGLRGGRGGQFAEARRLARGMPDHAVLDLYLGRRHPPLLSRGGHQHGARRGTGLAHRQPQVLHARRAAGHHHARLTHQLGGHPFEPAAHRAFLVGMEGQRVDDAGEVVVDGVDGRGLDAHAGPVGVQLFGQDHRQPGVDALAHFALGHDHGDEVVGADLDPAVEGHLARRCGQRQAGRQTLARRQQAPADGERGAGAQRAEDEVASFHESRVRAGAG